LWKAASSATHQPLDQYVDVDEFCRLSTSRKRLVRADDSGGTIRGLFDPDTQIRYLICERDLPIS
jgi:hypothetical protein